MHLECFIENCISYCIIPNFVSEFRYFSPVLLTLMLLAIIVITSFLSLFICIIVVHIFQLLRQQNWIRRYRLMAKVLHLISVKTGVGHTFVFRRWDITGLGLRPEFSRTRPVIFEAKAMIFCPQAEDSPRGPRPCKKNT